MSDRTWRSYIGAPRVYLTCGVHEDGEWKRMWHVSAPFVAQWFWTWAEAIEYALSLPVPTNPRPRNSPRTLANQPVGNLRNHV